MKQIVCLCGFVALLASAASGAADLRPRIKNLSLDVLYKAEGEVRIPTGENPGAHTLKLPSFPKKDGVLCMRFEAFLQSEKPGGWNPYLGLVLNGRRLDTMTETGEERLLVRGQSCKMTISEAEPWWGQRGGYPTLLTFFGPGDVLDERVISQREEGYWYLLDISDAANFLTIGADDRIESEAPNTLTFVNTLVQGYFSTQASYAPMVVRNLQVGLLPKEVVERLRFSALDRFDPIGSGPKLECPDFALIVAPSGGMQIRVGEDSYFISSLFSYPGSKLRFNALRPDEVEGQPCWKPQVEQTDARTIEVRAQGEGFTLKRTLTLEDRRIAVKDRIENRRQEPLGMIVRQDVTCATQPRPNSYYLSGVHRDFMDGGMAANPTLFVTQAASALGVLAEDNVLRLQLDARRRGNTFQYGTRHFGLDAGKSYDVEWTLYPSRSKDYFDFVNEIRRNWKVNFTVDGPFVFTESRNPRRKARIYAVDPWFDYHHDGSQTWESYKAEVTPKLAALKAAQPDVIIMPKIEANLYTVRKDRIPGGDALPGSNRSTGRYGFVLDKAQSAVLERGLGPWADSVIRTDDGCIVVDTYYSGGYDTRDNLFNLLLYLKEGNYRHRLFIKQVDFLMDEVGFTGIYIDQFNVSGPFSRLDRSTYHEWDGHTVDLDEQGRIRRKFTDGNLVGATARADILKHILAKGGQVVVNGQPTVRETQNIPVFRFQEMDNDNVNPLEFMDTEPPVCYWLAMGHLASPIILGLRPSRYGQAGTDRYAECVTKGIITALRNGVLYYYYSASIPESGPGAGDFGPCNHMFPFTPVELHAGWLVGEERTITCLSGTYRRPGVAEPKCLLFDRKGCEKPGSFRTRRDGDGWAVDVTLNDWNEIAVIE